MKHLALLLLYLVCVSTTSAQRIDNLIELKQQSENELFHRLGKAQRMPAFESAGYWVWGSSVVRSDDGKNIQ